MAYKTKDHGDLVSDLIDDQTENDDTDSEWPETDAKDFTLLGFGEVELCSPFSNDLGSYDETKCGCYKGDKATPK